MNFENCKEKYFIIVEGDERAVIRDTPEAAERKAKKTCKVLQGKKNHSIQSNSQKLKRNHLAKAFRPTQ